VGLSGRKAFVLTVSDGVAAGAREDTGGAGLVDLLEAAGCVVSRGLVPDEADQIAAAIIRAAHENDLILTTGGTGFGPRDVTPEATGSVIERDAPGLVHAMLRSGLEKTPNAALTRARAGTVGTCLVLNLPGSPRGARESLEAVIEVIPHALQLLSGDTEHH
jgi:molybdenum cofactor synthesis domain-containing protein